MIKRIKLRTLLLGGFITLLFVVLLIRMFALQVVQGDSWHEKGVAKWVKESDIPAERGTISDRNGDPLAINAPAYTVVVNPSVIHSNGTEDMVVEGLNKILGKDADKLKALVNKKDAKGEYLKNVEVRNEGWKIDETKKAQIDKLNDQLKEQFKDKKKIQETGLATLKESKRYYPKGTLASHVLGYTDREGKAVAGLEIYLNDKLEGTKGHLRYESDTSGDKLPNSNDIYQPAVNGMNYKLTIDDQIQYYIEDAMKEAYDKYKPISMTVIAADPKTMDILGMANLPTFDPNKYWETTDFNDFMNHAVKSVYEPGSTFKIVTLAGAVQEKLFDPNAKYLSGQIQVKGTKQVLHDIKRAGWGKITYLEGVKRSSNVAFVKLGSELLGKERLLKYITGFGFGEKTGIDLPGETSWAVNLPGPVEVATASYGHGVNVTPIQQLAAVSAIANGGKLMKPQIIKEWTDPNTGVTEVTKSRTVKQVISPEAAKETGEYLEQVVADQDIGTGRHAYIDGYRVAGKTGTAIKNINGQYDSSKSVVSFIGYAPVNDPKIAVIVIMDQPDSATVGGGTATAPVFKKIVSQSLQYMGVPKTTTTTKPETDVKKNDAIKTQNRPPAPDLVNKNVKEAEKQLLKSGIAFDTLGKGTSIMKQFPAKGTPMSPGQHIYLLTETDKTMEVPDLTGESLRDALDVLTLMKVSVNVSGEGYVSSQKVTNQAGKRVVQLSLRSSDDPGTGEDASTDTAEGDQESGHSAETGQSSSGKTDGAKNDQ
ncbi:penicillin-binding transpeptidase domain-containing protein [Paenibacillus dokdonensis]|uniref:Penicillin-binding transpeptidase domain-containing protein n=2 Tax=Paenibacillus dokdonensis TaxID=2567944 RepID=A0ABU6GXT2_9BACL|nr:penicillin-binding transpeptidase domain-containing protein [Paenibacillus dokdonensis]MEC0242992.1 penicillin-binding transpeptidase domain-containing protein [Paenibacillus dokdonensis]